MKPEELYHVILTQYPQHVVKSICHVDTSCVKMGLCPERQAYSVLDFDKIKDEFCLGTRTPSSVDAVCVGKLQKYFCFVELKGWNKYISYIDKQKNSVLETISGYNLEGKLKDSQELCKRIVGNPDIFLGMPIIFILVTDIDVDTHGIDAFAEMLGVLGETSTDIYLQCISESKKNLDLEIKIEHDYIYCKEFDREMATL